MTAKKHGGKRTQKRDSLFARTVKRTRNPHKTRIFYTTSAKLQRKSIFEVTGRPDPREKVIADKNNLMEIKGTLEKLGDMSF